MSSIGARTVRGMVWAYGSYVGQRVVVLASTAMLAHLLAPSAFGVVAVAMAMIAFLETLADLGLSQALVVVDDDEAAKRAPTVFVYCSLIGLALMVTAGVLGPAAASFFREPSLALILPVLGSTLAIRSLGATHYALAQKRLDFRLRMTAELADVGVRGLVGIGLALAGFGAWSLVLGYLAGAVVMTLTLWILVPWRISFRRSAPLGSLVGFGTRLTAVNVIAAVIANVDYLFVGRVLGAEALGHYTLGFKLPELLIINFSVVSGRVLFAAFAAAERRSLTAGFLRSMQGTLTLCLPLAVGLIMLGDPLIGMAFGDQWAASVGPMRMLCIYALAVAVGIPAGTIYKSLGRADILLRLAVPRAVLAIGAIALTVRHGILAVALSQVAVAALFSGVGIALAVRMLPVPLGALLRTVWAPVAATGGMAVCLLAVLAAGLPAFATVAAGAALGALTYCAVLWRFAGAAIKEVYMLAVPRSVPPAVSGDRR